jgi:hypothetical protein
MKKKRVFDREIAYLAIQKKITKPVQIFYSLPTPETRILP